MRSGERAGGCPIVVGFLVTSFCTGPPSRIVPDLRDYTSLRERLTLGLGPKEVQHRRSRRGAA